MNGTRISNLLEKITILFVICCFCLPAQAKYGGGTGEPNDPYLICNANQMNEIGLNEKDWDKHFKLMADIDLSGLPGTSFNIIGELYYDAGWVLNPFTGVFDGNGHTISNFTYTSTEGDNIGIFGYVDSSGEIKDLGLIDPNVDAGTADYVGSLVGRNDGGNITDCYVQGGSVTGGDRFIGGLLGYNWGTITNCYSTGSVSGNYQVGALVGRNSGSGKINNCYSTGSVTGGDFVGGLLGYNLGKITNCYSSAIVSGFGSVGGLVGHGHEGTITNSSATGNVTATRRVGGLVGAKCDYKISDCYSTGSVTGEDYVGGLVGETYGNITVSNCYSTASVSGDYGVGGLVGNNRPLGTISNCYSTGSASGSSVVGGLVGNNTRGTIDNCYSTGSALGTTDVGGLVGRNVGDLWYGTIIGTINNCYSSGSVMGEDFVGGLVGYNEEGEITDSFWDIETSGQETSDGGTGLPTDEMQMQITFTDAGWDFENIWWILEGAGYPRLCWEAKYGGGSGRPNDPYLIYTAEQMNTIGACQCDWEKCFKLMADIDLSCYTGTAFNIIGYYVDWSDNKPFTAVFDGNGHTISNFTYDSNGVNYLGLFGCVSGENAEIKNLGLIDPNVDAGAGDYVGSMVCQLREGTIIGCYVQCASVSGDQSVGGLVGHSFGTITNCYSTGSVTGNTKVGGLVGYSYGTITNCSSAGNVEGFKYDVGGLLGGNYEGIITTCYSTASVTGRYWAGGLVGWNYGSITNCYVDGGSVSATDGVGGLAGYNYWSPITNCYSTGSVSGDDYVGGLVGWNENKITNCYSTGSVTGDRSVGGLVGYNYFGYGKMIYNSFWDIETSGQTTSDGGTGKTTDEMYQQSTFTDWDFNTPVWTIDEDVDYPRLWWEFMPVLHAEPEVTLGTSNTISWEPVAGDVEYYAECAEDPNFTSILYSTGWITETSYEFTGLELGKRYWYSVKAGNAAAIESQWSNVESSLQCSLSGAVEIMLDPNNLKSENLKKPLLNKINRALEMIDEGDYTSALNKLQNDILAKMDGCGETGEPDKNDWIITCEEQSDIYPLMIETIEYIRSIME